MSWAAALSSVLGDASSGMASAAQYQASKHERNIAWKRAQQWELIQPSLRMAGLRQAGLNPILAATGGFQSGGVPQAPRGSPGGMPSFSRDTLQRAVATSKQMQALNDQLATIKYDRERSYHDAGRAAEEWSKAAEETRLTRELWRRVIAETLQTEAQTRRTEVDTKLMETGMPSAQAVEELYRRFPWLRMVGETLKQTRR